jgi:cation:H+ antiporter
MVGTEEADGMVLWLGFIVCTSLILFSGIKLSKYGDIIAEKTGLGRTFIGFVLFAAVTSMPELINGVGAVTYAGVPDIAVGDVLGSCVFNILILAFMDAFYRPQPIFRVAKTGHIIAASLGILLLSIAAGGIFLGERLGPVGWIGPYSVLIVAVYLVAMKLVYHYEKRALAEFRKEVAAELHYEDVPKRATYQMFAIHAVIVIVAAVFLPEIGGRIAEATGLGQTFVGNIFIALSTSLPEIVVSVAAVRMNAVDLAIGNIFGSNIFNIMVLAIDDVFFIRGPLFSHTDPNNVVPAISAIAMSAIAIIGLSYKSGRKQFFIAWDSMALMAVFLMNMAVLYMLRG